MKSAVQPELNEAGGYDTGAFQPALQIKII